MAEVNVGAMPHREAIEYFQQKLLIPSRQWTDMVGGVHAKAFTVAGATSLSLLEDLYNAVHNAILDGTTITQFRKDFDNIVARHGWSYKGKRGWRTNVIFRTNKRSAYMAGRWAQMWRLKDRRPYLMYLTVNDERVREDHRRWHRLILPIDHPFWNTHYPPNGWLCRCLVRSLSQADLDRMGVTPDRIGAAEQVEVNDPATGEVIKRTPGIDYGWDYNVGKSWLAPEAILGQQLMNIPADMRAKALKWFDNTIYDKPFARLVTQVTEQMLRGQRISVGHAVAVGFMDGITIQSLADSGTIPAGIALTVRDRDIAHWLRDTKSDRGVAIPASLAKTLPQVIRQPDAVLLDKSDNKLIYARRMEDGRYAKFVVSINIKTKLQHNKSRFKEVLNHVVTAGLVNAHNLKEGRYQLIQGVIE